MTDDITRGLAMLADEAAPPEIDSHAVITRARARTRNRRATAAVALATCALIGALVVTVGGNGPSKPANKTAVPPTAATLSDDLDRQLREILPDVIPPGWRLVPDTEEPSRPAPRFRCGIVVLVRAEAPGSDVCATSATYRDSVGDVDFTVSVSKREADFRATCAAEFCTNWAAPVRKDLPDGTRTQLTTYTENPTARDVQELLAARPDGTQISVAVLWPRDSREKTALTTGQIMKLATAFTYDSTLPNSGAANPTTTTPVTDDPGRPARLDHQLAAGLDEVVPDGWTPESNGGEPGFAFTCAWTTWGTGTTEQPEPSQSEGCSAFAYYRDGTGLITFDFGVARDPMPYDEVCREVTCVEKTLRDGTRTRLSTSVAPDPTGSHSHMLGAKRPDGTYAWVTIRWKEQRPTTPLTDDQLLKFATAFTF
jgi:hypothetical protein